MSQLKNENKMIVDVELYKELQSSFIDYSISVIISRALPDVRDGFKPSQRRIIIAMDKQCLFYNKSYKKSVKVVGEVMANYHPHGDTTIYQTMVGMAQGFNRRYNLLDGQGNWGSIDGDSPAAMRYTEVRMKKICNELLMDLDKNTVKMVSNFDETIYEPTVLPTKIPNLLINGSSGIAVGMATYIPPHNINEIMDAVIEVVKNKEVTNDELMQFVKGPDFPLGGVICGIDGIRKIYTQGRGSIIVRGIIEKEGSNGEVLVIKEIPYQVIKSDLVLKIADLSKNKVIEGISKIRDESNKKGIRVVIELKRDACSDTIINLIYKHTSLQVSLHVSLLALQNNKPVLFTLKSMLDAFIAHRKEVIYRRTVYDKNKAERQDHVLVGLKKILENLDEAIPCIRSAKNSEEASNSIKSMFGLSDEQAKAVLDLRLYKLTSMEREDIEVQRKKLLDLIKKLTMLIESPSLIEQEIINECSQIKDMYGDDRRTRIESSFDGISDPSSFIPNDEVVVTLTKNGYVKRVLLETYSIQHRGGKGKRGMTSLEEYDDLIQDVFLAKAHDELLFFTNYGRVYSSYVYGIPECSRIAKGRAIINLLPHLQEGEKVIKLMSSRSLENLFLMMVTKNGIVKKTETKLFSNIRKTGIRAITLNDGDELVFCMLSKGSDSVMLATKFGMSIRFYENEVRATGRSSIGVKGIQLKKNDEIIGALVIDIAQNVLFVTKNGYGKQVAVDKFRIIHRGGVGVRAIPTHERNGNVIGLAMVSEKSDLLLIDQNGKVIRISPSEIRTMGRQAKGLRLIKLDPNQEAACLATLDSPEVNDTQEVEVTK